MTSPWAWLAVAVVAQWLSVAALRASDGMRRPLWTLLTFAATIGSVGCVAVALSRGLTVAVAYGVWTGAGIALATLTGVLVFGDRLSRSQVAGLGLVIAAVVGLQVSGGGH
jgi:small multidrug resistance pump